MVMHGIDIQEQKNLKTLESFMVVFFLRQLVELLSASAKVLDRL
jgi:hypothetical protein